MKKKILIKLAIMNNGLSPQKKKKCVMLIYGMKS